MAAQLGPIPPLAQSPTKKSTALASWHLAPPPWHLGEGTGQGVPAAHGAGVLSARCLPQQPPTSAIIYSSLPACPPLRTELSSPSCAGKERERTELQVRARNSCQRPEIAGAMLGPGSSRAAGWERSVSKISAPARTGLISPSTHVPPPLPPSRLLSSSKKAAGWKEQVGRAGKQSSGGEGTTDLRKMCWKSKRGRSRGGTGFSTCCRSPRR